MQLKKSLKYKTFSYASVKEKGTDLWQKKKKKERKKKSTLVCHRGCDLTCVASQKL